MRTAYKFDTIGEVKPTSQTPIPGIRTPNPELRTPNPKPRTPNPEPRTPKLKPQTPNPTPKPQVAAVLFYKRELGTTSPDSCTVNAGIKPL